MSLQETVKSNPIYKEMQILKLEDLVLQNNCLFVYHHLLQKSLSATFDNYFHKRNLYYYSFFTSQIYKLYLDTYSFFQQIDKHGPHFHNILKVSSFSQIVFFEPSFFFTCYLFSHFLLLISFYSYIYFTLFYFILYTLSLFFFFFALFH